jgi:hypothetical protein
VPAGRTGGRDRATRVIAPPRWSRVTAYVALAMNAPIQVSSSNSWDVGSAEARVRLHSPSSLRGRDPRVVMVFGVAILECDLIFSADGGGNPLELMSDRSSLEDVATDNA